MLARRQRSNHLLEEARGLLAVVEVFPPRTHGRNDHAEPGRLDRDDGMSAGLHEPPRLWRFCVQPERDQPSHGRVALVRHVRRDHRSVVASPPCSRRRAQTKRARERKAYLYGMVGVEAGGEPRPHVEHLLVPEVHPPRHPETVLAVWRLHAIGRPPNYPISSPPFGT